MLGSVHFGTGGLKSQSLVVLLKTGSAAMQVACTDTDFKQNPQRVQPQPELLGDMAQAQFCLVMPGNTQSSGHLADAFFTGCIPVFLGPPFHTLPFPHLVRCRHGAASISSAV